MLVIQFKYRHNRNVLWTADYVRSFEPHAVPYNDEDEDQKVKPEDVLNHGYKDELSLNYSVYDGRSIDNILNCCDVNSPVNNMYAPRLFAYLADVNFSIAAQFGNLEWIFLRQRRSPLGTTLDGDVHSGPW